MSRKGRKVEMYNFSNKKRKRVVSGIIIFILILAMVVPIVLSAFLQ